MAQETTDTLSSKATNRVAQILSSLTLRAQFGTESNAGYKLKQHNGDLYEKGTIQEVAKIRMALNIPVLKTKFTTLSISPYYANHHLNFAREEVLSENLLMNMNGVHHTWGISTFGNFHTKLFGKQAAGMARFAIDGSEFGLERFTCMAVAIIHVKQTRSTSIGIGVLLIMTIFISIPKKNLCQKSVCTAKA